MEISTALQQYLDHQRYFKNTTNASLISSRQEIRFFAKSINASNVASISEETVNQYLLDGITNSKWKMSSVLTKRHTLSPFFDWCVVRGYLSSNPMLKLPRMRVEQRILPSLSRQQAGHLLDVAYNCYHRNDFMRYRSHAMIATCIFAGLRRAELFNLKVDEVDFDREAIFVNQGKGRKDRMIPISSTLSKILKEYIKQRQKVQPEVQELFCQFSGKGKYCGYAFKFILNRFARISGIVFTLNTLRHTFATLLLEGGADIHCISKMMGHADVVTTQRYLSVCVEHLRNQIAKHPLD